MWIVPGIRMVQKLPSITSAYKQFPIYSFLFLSENSSQKKKTDPKVEKKQFDLPPKNVHEGTFAFEEDADRFVSVAVTDPRVICRDLRLYGLQSFM